MYVQPHIEDASWLLADVQNERSMSMTVGMINPTWHGNLHHPTKIPGGRRRHDVSHTVSGQKAAAIPTAHKVRLLLDP